MKFANKIKALQPEIYSIIKIGDSNYSYLSDETYLPQSLSVNMKTYIKSLKMTAAYNGLASLNAKQCGIPYAFFVIKKELQRNQWQYANLHEDDYNVYVNPRVVSESKYTQVGFDECGSFPYMMLKKIRPYSIQVQYNDEKFERISTKLEDFLARVFLHECDDLRGNLLDSPENVLRPTISDKNIVENINISGMAQQLRNQNTRPSFVKKFKERS